jgi:hypothetical protein
MTSERGRKRSGIASSIPASVSGVIVFSNRPISYNGNPDHMPSVGLIAPQRIEIVGCHAMTRTSVVPERERILPPMEATSEVMIFGVRLKHVHKAVALCNAQFL